MENIYETVRISNYLQSLVQYGCFCYYSQKVHNVDGTICKRNSFASALYFGWNFICWLVVSIFHSSILGFKFSDNCTCLSPNSKVHFPVWVTLILVTLTSAFEFGYWNAIKWICSPHHHQPLFRLRGQNFLPRNMYLTCYYLLKAVMVRLMRCLSALGLSLLGLFFSLFFVVDTFS